MKNFNRLIYTDNLEESLEEVASLFKHHIKFYTEIIEKDKKVIKTFNKDFKIEHAKEVISKVHLKHSEPNAFLIAAPSYGIEAQNALLKILEEPPNNVCFIMFAKSPNHVLATIKSRLIKEDKRQKIPLKPLDLELSRLDLKDIYAFLKNLDKENFDSRENQREKIESLLESVNRHKIPLNEQELQAFDLAIKANSSYYKLSYNLLPLLLSLLSKKKTP
ncbi:DNA polymerase III subunit delta' [Helicobacter pylori]|uniref:DNA polymerase III subunit delta' n=1 Tax=Helicobacter pylori TaxID=210 RepID=UPI0007188A3C|nr:DNA polymerase III subunit delta' [Helicobacter pylori]OKB10256.1 DNA polymerase III subunit delta' [Helicobacter pylori]OKB13126.1 DNA polymerase III subunit delta' [Helicobacter pylori]OKB22152.1 DNA polymerase III subunit delta' [Helicobacter pylori]